MIYGIGTDIAAIERFSGLLQRHGQAAAEKILSRSEWPDFERTIDKGRFLAKRFAAKEAFGKALGTGIREPATLPAIGIGHDALGKPLLSFSDELSLLLRQKNLVAHLSLSDERDYVVAFVILEECR